MSSDLVHTQREIDNLINLLSDARTENMRLNEYTKRQAMDIILCKSANDTLHEENTRLRAALREIVRLEDEWVPQTQDDYSYGGYAVCSHIARAALEGLW